MIVEGKVSSKRKEKKEGCGSKGVTGGGRRVRGNVEVNIDIITQNPSLRTESEQASEPNTAPF